MRRILAMFIDIILVLMYALLVFLINVTLPIELTFNEVTANLVGIVTMILPVGLYFYLCESRFGFTLGKRLFHLRVDASKGNILLRTLLFVLPWMFGHMFAYRGFYSDWSDQIGLLIIGCISYGLLCMNYGLMIFRKDHKGYHEILSGTKVNKE